MDILCPTCQVPMESVTDAKGGKRKHYACRQCEAEYFLPREGKADSDTVSREGSEVAAGGSPPTVPGVKLKGVLGPDLEVPEELRFSLKVLEGTETGKTYEVNCSRVTVGREEGEIVLGDPLVSRKHAAFEIYGSHHIVVKDLASTNGTYLNGRLIAYSKLNNGDRVKVGTTVLEAVIEVGG